MEQTPDHARRLESMIRTGTVAEIDYGSVGKKPPRVRIQSGGLLTDWLPWGTSRAGSTRTWSPPSIGEQVVLLSPDGDTTKAIVMTGASYQDIFPPPSDNPDEEVISLEGGGTILYDRKQKTLKITGIKNAIIQSDSECIVKAPTIKLDGKVVITEDLEVEGLIQFGGLKGKGKKGSPMILSGDIQHIDGNFISNGVTLHTHTHRYHDGTTDEPK